MKATLTPALSHPMGEGELFAVDFVKLRSVVAGRHSDNNQASACCSLSHRMGEGQGEGNSEI